MRRLVIVLAALLSAAPVLAQSRVVCDEASGTCAVANGTRENFTSNRRGTQGTIGNQESRPSSTNGSVGATQSRCYADGNGNTYCQ